MESFKLIRLSLIIFSLINYSQCKPGWPFAKLSIWGRSSKPLSQLESESSVKHAELCEYVCKKEPEEGQKYCDCELTESPISSSGAEGSAGHKQISLSDYFNQETNSAMKQQMCSLICSEDSNEASKYCDCDGSKTSGKSKSKQSTKFSGFQTLSDYFKPNNKNDNNKSINSDETTRRQLCEYICSDDPDEAKQYCDCNQIKEQNNLIAQHYNQYHYDSNQQQRQGNNNRNVNGGGNNNFSIKNLLSPNHGHSQEDICKVICAIEPDNDDGQCGCNDNTKESKFRWPWQTIRQWFG